MRVDLISAAYFEILGVQPVMGRPTVDEDHEGIHYVAAISAQLWGTYFATEAAILGRKIYINDEPYSIVAVMPDTIPAWMDPGPGLVAVWTPFAFANACSEGEPGARGYSAIARMKPGVSLEQAQADLEPAAAALAAAHPVDQGIGVATRIADTRVGKLRPRPSLLAEAVSLILLIACVNQLAAAAADKHFLTWRKYAFPAIFLPQ